MDPTKDPCKPLTKLIFPPGSRSRPAAIADIEAGRKTGSAASLKAIAAALAVPLDVIVG
jgi:hypothetical protein